MTTTNTEDSDDGASADNETRFSSRFYFQGVFPVLNEYSSLSAPEISLKG